MYIPPFHQEKDTEILVQFMQQHNFVSMISKLEDELIASHIPVTLEQKGNDITITGHLARSNPQVNSFDKNEALLIFTGPHAYISPSHYEQKASVPTWNYVAVHAYGIPKALSFKDQPKETEAMLMQLVHKHENSYEKQWHDLSEHYKQGMMKGIIGFTLKIDKLQGKYKLSQNRTTTEQQKIAQALLTSTYSEENETGKLMQEKLELE